MNKKKIIIILTFVVIVFGICLLLIFNKDRKTEFDSGEEPSNFVVDVNNTDNVVIENNTKINNSEKVKNKVYAKSINDGSNNFIYIDNVSNKADINNDTCIFEGIIHNEIGKDIGRLLLNIVFYSSNEKIIGTAEYYVSDLKNNDTSNIKIDFEDDISNTMRYTVMYDIME